MTKILFVSANLALSTTAERIFSKRPGVLVKAARTDPKTRTLLPEDDLLWSDLVLCMESNQKEQIENQYSGFISGKMIASLDIPDNIPNMNTQLIEAIETKTEAKLFTYQLRH